MSPLPAKPLAPTAPPSPESRPTRRTPSVCGQIVLGSRVHDQISGFSGLAIGRAVYVFEEPKILVAPEATKDGAPGEACWLSEQRLAPSGDGRAVGFVAVLEPPTS